MKAKDFVGACSLHESDVTRHTFTKKKCFQCMYFRPIERTKIKNSLRRINYIECYDWRRAKQQMMYHQLEPFKRSVISGTATKTKRAKVGASLAPGQKQI
jgi:hypothetical protein